MIEIRNVSKTFKTEHGDFTALKNVSLTINDGEIFGIIGLSGAGKSTLVRCINLLERPTEGDVLLDGVSLVALPRKELLKTRRSIGMIFQGFNLLAQRTALKNVCYPLEIAGYSRADAESRARELLELVKIADKAGSYPSQLSGGQKQRVAIARALATNPKVLLCDEATSALDPNTTQSILELLKDINQKLGVTIVVITHEMRVIDQICDRVAVIEDGIIVEEGPVSRVFTNPQSNMGRELILSGVRHIERVVGEKKLRVIFNGESTYEPVISNMILETQTCVGILYADLRARDGKDYGYTVIQLPDDERAVEKIYAYLDGRGMKYAEEV
ncbi:MAG: ATP-binding cassette domain-containing protein [Oscillospiraceae bacterium]|nr:ATP-binding cassette domain-containing protein [Oscillospiraceae bacterium]